MACNEKEIIDKLTASGLKGDVLAAAIGEVNKMFTASDKLNAELKNQEIKADGTDKVTVLGVDRLGQVLVRSKGKVVSKVDRGTGLDENNKYYEGLHLSGRTTLRGTAYTRNELEGMLDKANKTAKSEHNTVKLKEGSLKAMEKELKIVTKRLAADPKNADIKEDLEIIEEDIASEVKSIEKAKRVAKNSAGYAEEIKSALAKDSISGFTAGGVEVIAKANKYTSEMLIMGGSFAMSQSTPLVSKWHEKAKTEFEPYNRMVSSIDKGLEDSDTWNQLKVTLRLTGDTSERKIMEVMNKTLEVEKANFQLLQDHMVKLEKDLETTLGKGPAKQKAVDDAFGTSGLGNLGLDSEVAKEFDSMIKSGEIDIDRLIKKYEAKVKKVERNKNPFSIQLGKNLAKYMVDGEAIGSNQNTDSTHAKVISTLYALKMLDEGRNKVTGVMSELHSKNEELYYDMMKKASLLKYQAEEMNQMDKENSGYQAGNYVHKVFDKEYDTMVVSQKDMMKPEFTIKNSVWEVAKKPTRDAPGVVYKLKTRHTVTGAGTGVDRYKEGYIVDMEQYADKKNDWKWMSDNNIVEVNGEYRQLLKTSETDMMRPKNNFAHTFFRTHTHNQVVMETQGVRDIISDQMTSKVDSEDKAAALAELIRNNKKVGAEDRSELPTFLDSKFLEGYDKKEVATILSRYEKVSGVSKFGGFNKKVHYVRTDMKSLMMGHTSDALVSAEWPTMHRMEQYYIQLVQLAKIHMVVAAPVKLATDIVSNAVLLSTLDVPIEEMIAFSKKTVIDNKRMTDKQNKLIQVKFDLHAAKANNETNKLKRLEERVRIAKRAIELDPFYDAMRFGFHTSMGTDLMIKEYDTVTGLQHNIDEVISKVVKDDKGNHNEVGKALAWWMKKGYGLDDALMYAAEASKKYNSTVAEELTGMADRWEKKRETEDTVRMISEIIGSPSSEIVRQGSRVMTMGDMIAKNTLFLHEVRKNKIAYKKEYGKLPKDKELEKIKIKAATMATEMFFAYNQNMPEAIDNMSRYGVMMFPSFWIRAQKVVWNLAKYHPLNVSTGMIMAHLTGEQGITIMSANLLNKIDQDTVAQFGLNVADMNTFTWMWK